MKNEAQSVEMIPVDRVIVINPRVRNKRIFKEIIANIAEIGLKKPITVTRRDGPDGLRYDLVAVRDDLKRIRRSANARSPPSWWTLPVRIVW